MASRVSINYKETAIDAISYAGRYRLGRVQRADVGANLPNTPVKELGSDKLVGRIFDLPEVTATVNAFDVGARTAFTLAGVDWASAASGTRIEAQEMRYVCLAQSFKGAGTSNDIARTLYVPGAKLERFSYNYSVGGDATEEYSFSAVDRRWLKYDVATASGTLSASGTMTFSPAARVLKDGTYVLSIFASGLGYITHDAITAQSATSVTLDTASVPASTPVLITYHADLTDQWQYTYDYPHVAPGYTPPPDQPVGVRGWGVEVYLVESGQINQRVYRAQTCTIQGQYPNTKIQELGNEAIVGYIDDIPEITGTLDIIQSDFRLQELLMDDSTGDNWDPNELGSGDWGLLVKVFRRGANRANDPEKTLWLPALDITQEQNQSQVGQDSRVTFNFSSRTNECFVYKGAPTGGVLVP
jgi:hypothetical protein